MCGIVAGFDFDKVERGVDASRHRGPDASGVVDCNGVVLGHARLAIIDLDARSDQPFTSGAVTVSFNGEIWNYAAVRADLEGLGRTFRTAGDTEVVAAALDQWGVDGLLRLNGMFAVAWSTGQGDLRLAVDRFGEIPLHYTDDGAASELKVLQASGFSGAARSVPPGGVVLLGKGNVPASWPWHRNTPLSEFSDGFEAAAAAVGAALVKGVTERTLSDVPVCTLLSGGLDSTAVAWAASRTMPNLVAYTAVMDPKSGDLRNARLAADAIGCELREVTIPQPTADDLRRTVRTIEMPYKAQVEIGWACLVLADRIAGDGFKVVFSGEGSDELWASYGFSYHGVQAEGWHPYRRRLFLEQYRKNFARCNKAFMSRGVECRLPFLHPPLVDLAWSLPQACVRKGSRPKAVLEQAFADVLPQPIVRRAKVAFQDGLGMKDAAASAVPTAASAFYRAEFIGAYGETADHRRSAGEDRRSEASDHGDVRTEVGDIQRALF